MCTENWRGLQNQSDKHEIKSVLKNFTMQAITFTVIFIIFYAIGIFGFSAIILPITNVIPRAIKRKQRIPLLSFVSPVIWIAILYFIIRYGLNKWGENKYAIYFGLAIPLVQVLIKSIKGGADLEADIQSTYGKDLASNRSESTSENMHAIQDHLSKIKRTGETLIICFNTSSDFVNIRFEKEFFVISFPLVTDRMKSKRNRIIDLVQKNGLDIISDDIAGIKIKIEVDNTKMISELLTEVFALTYTSDLEYEIR